ncbi:hypothetical protein [Paraburkholderia youngii]|uniref:Uncharacterized protein n=1 Tax=Paraburkholderia youngii TaxID=2782701 RepID=A0A7W8LDJ0_9BURK|nr:hypothetical protein [Paraburkholderia youngii]MBB5405052.1 hypothetical protein [Paraburkholderia youngii]
MPDQLRRLGVGGVQVVESSHKIQKSDYAGYRMADVQRERMKILRNGFGSLPSRLTADC